ncbi:hypothetical protein SAZ_32610 [Streptomyces noursei ZPM]|uniref:Uncharacterized protein n=1 Tax=Streptomyces noursei TaxID=1971 RepID=A0A401R9V3_STRNR|nr:hypothetical protein [Streptomyces noursei]AKA08983.1 hypothetical protein SAZ_32610 [Streptomyces noursei ZPM]EOT05915.1 hypothetical protein K530_01157 [Streptomyces noursei CCRC 11814]EXU92674.1 hypothetical protein P354_15185 [Streptomyces noursei PD-1]UWS75165.1 hypothetical protein N1H47_30360 [Streptomyces noursei]GCB94429.1 hypothetical protein SALB_07228 [Streptomyces noursei]
MIQHVRRKIANASPAVPEITIPISHALQTAVKSVFLLRISLGVVLSTGVTVASLINPESVPPRVLLTVSVALCVDRSGLLFYKLSRHR